MSHYVGLIKALGPPAHFSTDQSEHMHIQAAKVPYRKSNRRNYMLQIVNRLDLTEHMREQDEYFEWRKLVEEALQDETFDDSGSDTDSDDEDEIGMPEEESDGERGDGRGVELPAQDGGVGNQSREDYEGGTEETHTYPRRPFRSQVPLPQVTREHGELDLYRQLQLYYFRAAGGAAATRRVIGYELEPLPFTCVDLYKQFRVRVPAPPYEPKAALRLTVKADPKGGKKVQQRRHAYYSTVLLDENRGGEPRDGLKGQPKKFGEEQRSLNLLFCYVVRLPVWDCTRDHEDSTPAGQGEEKRVVAYVDWFTRFTGQPNESKMYRIGKAYQTGTMKRDSAVVNITSIRRPCHLIPAFGGRIPNEWRSWNVLELADTFFVSSFIDQDMYQRMY